MNKETILLFFLFCSLYSEDTASTQESFVNSIQVCYQNNVPGFYIYNIIDTYVMNSSYESIVKLRGRHSVLSMFGVGFTFLQFKKQWNTLRVSLIFMPEQNMQFNEACVLKANDREIPDPQWEKDTVTVVKPLQFLQIQLANIFRIKLLPHKYRVQLRLLCGLGVGMGILYVPYDDITKPVPMVYGYPLLGLEFHPINHFSISGEATYDLGVSRELREDISSMNITIYSDSRYMLNGIRASVFINYYP